MSRSGDTPAQLLWRDPPVAAADYTPAIWVPLTRLLTAHRRLLTMADRLPEEAWQDESAAPGWRRRDVLLHLAAHGCQHHRPLVAVLAGDPLREWLPDPTDPSLDSDGWNARRLAKREEWSIPHLVVELESNMAESLQLWAQIDDSQLLQPYGLAANLLAGLERHSWHLDHHADQIVNGPQMLR